MRICDLDGHLGKPDVLPAFGLLGVRESLWRCDLFRAEDRPTFNDFGVYHAVHSTVFPIERTDQYAAFPAEDALGKTASLPIVARIACVSNPNGEGPLLVRDIDCAMLAAKVAVTGSRMIGAGFMRDLQIHLDISAMTASGYSVHFAGRSLSQLQRAAGSHYTLIV